MSLKPEKLNNNQKGYKCESLTNDNIELGGLIENNKLNIEFYAEESLKFY